MTATTLIRGVRTALCVVLAAAVALLAWTPPSWADEVDEARAVLDAAEGRLASITQEYNELSAEVDELQSQIDATAQEALEAQSAVLEGRKALGSTAASQYRDDQTASLFSILLDSESFPDLLRNIEYVTRLMNYQANEIEAQKERQEHLQAITEELNAQKDAQVAAMDALETKKAEASSVVAAASDRLRDAKAAEAERLAELERQAAALEQAQQVEEPAQDPNANTTNREDAVPPSSGVTEDPAPSPSPGSGWKTGIASAYGGSSDPYTPNPGITASGTVCDDNSMGVAIPASTPNARSYFGRTVEISYNGRTVYATVEDTGNLDGGSRALDLQPGVFKAFGFDTCRAWGLRTVSYRFL